jgi:hypothetical protein
MRKYHAENRERVNQANREARERRKTEDPDAWSAKVKEYNKKYQSKNPKARTDSVRKYREANRQVCIRRTIKCIKTRRAVDLVFDLKLKIASSLSRRIAKAKGFSGKTKTDITEIVAWFEWLRVNGHADWTASGIHIDHVVPLSRWNLKSKGAPIEANKWRNLYPMTASDNLQKSAKIVPNQIRRVWRLADEYLNQRKR